MLHLSLKCFIVVVIIHGNQTVGQSVCQYDLNYNICLTHLSQQSNPVCQNINLIVGVEEVCDESLLMILTNVESPQQNIDDVSVKINLLNHTAPIETSRNISDYERDVVRGLTRIFKPQLLPPRHISFQCKSRQEEDDQDFIITTEKCTKTLHKHPIYYIESVQTEKKEKLRLGKLQELHVSETFLRHSNFNKNIGESVIVKLFLKLQECENVKYPANMISESTMESDIDDNRITDIQQEVMKENNPLTLIQKLKPLLLIMNEDELAKFFKKYRKSTNFGSVLEACGSVGSLKVHKIIFKILTASKNTQPLLEKYVISLSFAAKYETKITTDLLNVASNAKYMPEIQETCLYCACKQAAKEEEIKMILKMLVGCRDDACKRKRLYCIAAFKTDSYAKDVIESIEDKEEDKIIRETAAVVLSKLQHNEDVLKQDRMLDMAMSRPTDMSHQLFIKILELISFDKLEKSTLLKILEASGDRERKAFITQKMISHNTAVTGDYSIISHAAQGESVYMFTPFVLDAENNVEAMCSFSTTMLGSSLSRTAFSMSFKDIAGHRKDLMSIHSYIGGLSGLTGEPDPEDDGDANASLHISILGLPLRPLVLFTSVSDLIDMYWSGAGQEKTTLLQGTLDLEDTHSEFQTFLGIRISMNSNIAVHLHSQGEGSISIWTQTGAGNLETDVSLAGASHLQLEAPGGIAVTSNIELNTGLRVHTTAAMGNPINICLIMSSQDLVVRLEVNTDSGSDVQHHTYPGVTFNLGNKINKICDFLM